MSIYRHVDKYTYARPYHKMKIFLNGNSSRLFGISAGGVLPLPLSLGLNCFRFSSTNFTVQSVLKSVSL